MPRQTINNVGMTELSAIANKLKTAAEYISFNPIIFFHLIIFIRKHDKKG